MRHNVELTGLRAFRAGPVERRVMFIGSWVIYQMPD
jgi:hypothetical protein